jgi:hypothetical protein
LKKRRDIVCFFFFHLSPSVSIDEPNIRKHFSPPKHNSSKIFSHTHSTRIHTETGIQRRELGGMTQTPSSHEYKKVLQPETKKQKQSDTGKRERERGGDRENIWGEIRSERKKKKKKKKQI